MKKSSPFGRLFKCAERRFKVVAIGPDPSGKWSCGFSCRFHNAVESSGVNAEGLRDLPDQLAFFEQPLCKLSLLFVHFLWTSEANAAFVGVGATGACAFANQVSLELGDAGEDGHDHFAGMGGGVCPRLGEALEAGTGLVIFRRSRADCEWSGRGDRVSTQ